MKIENFNVSSGANVNIISDSNVTIRRDEKPVIERKDATISMSEGEFIEPMVKENDESTRLLEQGKPYFTKAVEAGFMEERSLGYEWKLSKTLLAYFIGKIYCGDYVAKDKYGETWKGDEGFPDKFAEKIFGLRDIGVLRRNKFTSKATPPKGYDKIDAIF